MKKYLLLVVLILLAKDLSAQTAKLNQLISSYAKTHHFNGTLLVKQDNKVLYHESFGVADRAHNVPVQNQTTYKIASVTKTFTATLILQLYEQGKLDLNAHISTYLPEYKGEAANKVTIHQLLNHTSGIHSSDTLSSAENGMKYGIGFQQKPYTSNELMDKFSSDSLVSIPGQKFYYSNGDYVILGKIIEKIYLKSYDQVLREQIIEPLKMTHTGMLYQRNIVKNLASSYYLLPNTHQLVCDPPFYIEDWYAAGAMYSCTEDLAKFSDALFSHRLIKQETLNLMTRPGLDNYGYGAWIRGEGSPYKRLERYGSIWGSNSILMRFLNKDVTVICLSNTNMTNLGDYALEIGKMVIE